MRTRESIFCQRGQRHIFSRVQNNRRSPLLFKVGENRKASAAGQRAACSVKKLSLTPLTVISNFAISTYDSLFGNPDDVKVDGIPSIWDYVMAMSIRGLAGSFGGFSIGGNSVAQGGGKLIGHHVIPVYTCGHLDQRLSNLPKPIHDSLHTQLYNYTLAINVLGYAVDLIVYRRPTSRTVKTPMQRLGAKAVGRAAIAAGLGFFYNSEDLLGVGSLPIGVVLALETPRYIGKHNSAPDCQRQR